MRLTAMAAELDACARCHEQCLFASTVVLATGRHTLAPSRKALLADLLQRGELSPSAELADVFALGIGSGLEHEHCLYAGAPIWPDETRISRAARADLVDLGFPASAAIEAAERIDATGDPFGLGGDASAFLVGGTTLFFTDAATRALTPDVGADLHRLILESEPQAEPLPTSARSVAIPSSAGFEALELGLEARARLLVEALLDLADRLGVSRIVSGSPEALVALREFAKGDIVVAHASEWLASAWSVAPPARLASRSERRPRVAVLHDSPRLGRMLGTFDAPRLVLDRISGIERREFGRSRERAIPSGPTFGFPDANAAHVMAECVVDDALAVGADLIVCTSPYDRRNIAAVVGQSGIDVRDVLEIAAEGLS